MEGYVHSTESFGTVDGPGVRFVVFLQGCPMRCQYCHNPDTWKMNTGAVRSAQSLIKDYERNAAFYKKGGITVTGGEALMQIDFVLELFRLAKQKNIHTCLDTSGIAFPADPNSPVYDKIEKLMDVTDLILLDIKHIDEKDHQALTGRSNRLILAFARYLNDIKKPVWIRHVVVPGITYNEKDLTKLGLFLRTLKNIEKIEILPYHSMGKEKYERLGYKYALANTPELTKAEATKAEKIIVRAMLENN